MINSNFKKYLIDKDGYVVKHYACSALNYDIERTLKEDLMKKGSSPMWGPERSTEVFEEEYAVITGHIERLINGERSLVSPLKVSV